jgi:NAD(P)-dependent dehydrogenase (short-subunit alcohol dehydrogenase family)
VTQPPADVSSLFRLDGRRALVIGAGGIGAACAAGLAAHGAEVTCADVSLAAAQTAMATLDGGGSAMVLDVADRASVEAAAELYAPGAPDVVVLTPAINVRKRMLHITDDEFDRVLDVNLRGTFRVLRTFGRVMADAGGGSIIGFSSIRSQVTEPGQGAYAATKAAMVMLFRTLAAELAPAGVRANCVAPGVVETPLTAQIKAEPAWYDAYAARNALGRWAQPIEMVGAVVYLASDASSYVTGTTLFVDGGWTAVDGRFDPPT